MHDIIKTIDAENGDQLVFNITKVPSLNGPLYLASASGGPGGEHFFHLSRKDGKWKIVSIISGADWIFQHEGELGNAIEENMKS